MISDGKYTRELSKINKALTELITAANSDPTLTPDSRVDLILTIAQLKNRAVDAVWESAKIEARLTYEVHNSN